MKRILATTGLCIIHLITSVCCNTTYHKSKIHSNSLVLSLMKDGEDGRLDMPFDEACLIASGVNSDKKMQKYRARINLLISHIDQSTDIGKTDNPAEKAKILFNWLQKNAHKGVYDDCYDLRDTFNLKVGNCLSYAIRFTILCRYFGVDIQNIFIPGHIYNMVESYGQTYYFEHTHSDGIVKKPDREHPQRRIMKDTELISEIFLYKARNTNNHMKYDESIKYCKQALLFSPHDNRPVILLLDNYLVKENYESAFLFLDTYLLRHPEEKKPFKTTYTLLQRVYKKR